AILSACGFMIQVMPGADEELITRLEDQSQTFPSISKLSREGNSSEQILEHLFGKEEVKVHEQMPITFRCKCSKERIERAIKGLGNEEIQAMIDEDHGAEATCHFCNKKYYLTEDELVNLKQ